MIVKVRGEQRSWLAILDQVQAGKRSKREHEHLVPVGHGGVAVAAGDFLTLDGAAVERVGQRHSADGLLRDHRALVGRLRSLRQRHREIGIANGSGVQR